MFSFFLNFYVIALISKFLGKNLGLFYIAKLL
jgi:uncharacterized membrane protein YtjA (UPF0391 family)